MPPRNTREPRFADLLHRETRRALASPDPPVSNDKHPRNQRELSDEHREEHLEALLSPSGDAADGVPDDDARCSLEDDRRLDPMARHLAAAAGIIITPPTAVAPTDGLTERLNLARAQTLEQMLPALVRKAAWQIAPDRRSATLHLEIGSGPFDGTTVLIRADLDEIRIELDAPPGIDLEAWKSRLRRRLASQGLTAHIS